MKQDSELPVGFVDIRCCDVYSRVWLGKIIQMRLAGP